MDSDRIKGKGKDIAGRVQRQAGEWTGDPKDEVKGAAKQAEGKAQNAWGKVKDEARDLQDRAEEPGANTKDEAASDETITRKRETEVPLKDRNKRAA